MVDVYIHGKCMYEVDFLNSRVPKSMYDISDVQEIKVTKFQKQCIIYKYIKTLCNDTD